MGSNSISKIRNSNSKRTEVQNFILRRTTVQNSILKWTTVQNLETDWYFEGPDVSFRRLDFIRRVTIFKGHLKVQMKPRLFKGLGRFISKARLYLKSGARADQNISKIKKTSKFFLYILFYEALLTFHFYFVGSSMAFQTPSDKILKVWNTEKQVLAFISKVWNTKHTGSDFILKVQNSNLKRTEVLNFISRRTTVWNSILRWTTLSLKFRDRPVQMFHFKDWTLFEGPDEVQTIRRSWTLHFEGQTLFEGSCFLYAIVKGKWKNDEKESLLNKISKVHGFPDAF
ncbi:hypothetical protein RclHR1_05110002 [Rhizophagus clarus]|uniref:Uncharacterized protein n=1 Tax=Rhizophagus clarus TaxID=94130 RepID=A0A2Z6SEG7_9GLOM|nr:hypothetical protein RclHR1_05110002 [Rhizophagus clarus]